MSQDSALFSVVLQDTSDTGCQSLSYSTEVPQTSVVFLYPFHMSFVVSSHRFPYLPPVPR